MGTVGKQRIALIALIGLWELFVLHEALAGPPLEKVGAALSQSNASRPAPSLQSSSGHLDLRPPSALVAGSDALGTFAAAARPKILDARNSSRSETSGGPPRASVPVASGHVMSPLETMAHNFHQEGLPMARLFENQDSLVHLGLNQKGKPGLWIVHKLH
jgi:hypothetical protein